MSLGIMVTLSGAGAQVGVLEQTNQVSLAGLLKSQDSKALEAQISLEVLSDFPESTKHLNGSLWISSSVDFWYQQISFRAMVPGL